MKTYLIFALVFGTVYGGQHGIDINDPVSTTTFECLKKNGFSFVIPRVYHSNGVVDHDGVQNVKNANAAGFTEVDGYLFPCPKCSASAATQVKDTINALNAAKAKINTLWLDIERYNWPASHATNRAFIEAAVKEAEALKQKVGIYSNNNNWEAIVGLDYTAFSNLELWWADYNGQLGFDAYKEFGGWKKPYIHQYHDTEKGPCGVSVDLNYIP